MKRVVTIGGGGGQAALLRILRTLPDVQITAVVNVVDDGGSTGRLMKQLGVQSMGDVRNCLAAMADPKNFLAAILNQRFQDGELAGHAFGNILLAALEKKHDSFLEACRQAAELCGVGGRILPAAAKSPALVTTFDNGEVVTGQRLLVEKFWAGIDEKISSAPRLTSSVARLNLEPATPLLKEAETALKEADVIIIANGDLYSSVLPFFLLEGVATLWPRLTAKKILLPNATVTHGHVHGRNIKALIDFFRAHSATFDVDQVIIPSVMPPAVAAACANREYGILEDIVTPTISPEKIIRASLLDDTSIIAHDSSLVQRSPIRYNEDALRNVIQNYLYH